MGTFRWIIPQRNLRQHFKSLSTHLCCWWLLVNHIVTSVPQMWDPEDDSSWPGVEKWFHGCQVLSSSVNVRCTAWSQYIATRTKDLSTCRTRFSLVHSISRKEQFTITASKHPASNSNYKFSRNPPPQVVSSWGFLVGTVRQIGQAPRSLGVTWGGGGAELLLLWSTDVTCEAPWDQLLIISPCSAIVSGSPQARSPPAVVSCSGGSSCAESQEDFPVSLNNADHFTMNYLVQLFFWGAVGMGSTTNFFQFSLRL